MESYEYEFLDCAMYDNTVFITWWDLTSAYMCDFDKHVDIPKLIEGIKQKGIEKLWEVKGKRNILENY